MSPFGRVGRASKQGFALILAGALLACGGASTHTPAGRAAFARSDAKIGTENSTRSSTTIRAKSRPKSSAPYGTRHDARHGKTRDTQRSIPREGAPEWLGRPPRGCAAGHSGPTLDPGDAIRQARRSALEQLAAQQLGVRVESELRLDARGWVSEATTQEVYGILGESRIVAMTSRAAGGRRPGSSAQPPLRELYALACRADAARARLPKRAHPDWLLDVPSDPMRICVLGVGGPTRHPDRQRDAALRDGRSALAEALETLVHRHMLDDGRSYARVRSSGGATARAAALASAVESLDEEWVDESGQGPLATPGVVYGLVCAGR